MASVNKRTTESKFVSCFADARPDVDITFRDVLLSRPTDHYLVGVDNFTMTSTGLSMIEPLSGDYAALIRIVANRQADAYDVAQEQTGASLDAGFLVAPHPLAHVRVTREGYNFEVATTEVQLSFQQLLHRLNELAASVNLYMHNGFASGGNGFAGEFNYTPADDEDTEHLRFDVRSDGRLEIRGTRAFWGCFSIEVPSPQYQFGFFGDRQGSDDNDFRLRRFLSINPATGIATFNKIRVNPAKREESYFQAQTAIVNHPDSTFAQRATAQALIQDGRAYNARTIFGATPQVLTVPTDLGPVDADTFNIYTLPSHKEVQIFTSQASIFSTMERRVALEVGCSLPIKNSPMVDHQRETPDFVLGRWIWCSDSHIESNDRGGSRRYGSPMPACFQYQGPQDRVTYHELQAQAKIQTLRVKLFARVRSFDTVNETWTMRVIALPTSSTDWWHARLHFVSKD